MLKKCSLHKTLVVLFLVLANVFPAIAQLSLGGMTMVSMDAPPLKSPSQAESQTIYSPKSLSSVGGVAFEKIALPADTFKIHSLALAYEPQNDDGHRLVLKINDQNVYTSIYDWQLGPISRYADSPYYACFTYFGKLIDKQQEKQILDKGGKIVNYHPAFENTLIGLRLMQTDLMLMYNECVDLPKQDGQYILGAGESAPNIRQNQSSSNDVIQLLNKIENDIGYKFQSYLICDYQQDIRFSNQSDTLQISGHPYFYFWRPKYKAMSEREMENLQNNLIANMEVQLKHEENQSPTGVDQRSWYLDELLKELKRYEMNYNIYSGGTLVDALAFNSDNDRRNFLNQYQTSSLVEMLVDLRFNMDIYTPIFIEKMSEGLSSRAEKLRAMNPAIWDVATLTMRYAAFFRYCKTTFPDKWDEYIQQINNISIEPAVKTPTVIWE